MNLNNKRLRSKRLAICAKCPNQWKDPIAKTRWCGLCKCNLFVKAGMEDKHCADNPPRW